MITFDEAFNDEEPKDWSMTSNPPEGETDFDAFALKVPEYNQLLEDLTAEQEELLKTIVTKALDLGVEGSKGK